MSRERSPLRKKALKLWLDSNRQLQPTAIARALGTSGSQIRKWKSLDKWDELPEGPRKKGAQPGNKNAKGNKGGGAPKGNRNAFKNGNGAIWEDSFDWVERMLLYEVDTDPVGQINNQIRMLEIRERRCLLRINQIMDGWDQSEQISKSQLIDEETEVTMIEQDGKVAAMTVNQPRFGEVERITKTPQQLERILSIEETLTRIQDKKAKLIDMKTKLGLKQLSEQEAALRIQKMQLEIKKMEEAAW
ncbi:phage terminase small subunit [Paenibacillus aurantiacus]|uniref:Phage terminase small subunit n=1 Tax=Paenibacillus aurantiacus TaxID=1936118 RepID=A0ABV5KP32_9BACL